MKKKIKKKISFKNYYLIHSLTEKYIKDINIGKITIGKNFGYFF